ncbi:MAG TPA: bifunctional diaminohydroxyphosphoribosylaminopyrimidine deaminase/5-amino-6-(5-phosphoribosylamino)uracil reductase RibD [Acidimicrobiales bacterium]
MAERSRKTVNDEAAMARAIELAASVRATAHPNPWVGAVVEPGGYEGATEAPGGRHAEAVALDAAGDDVASATMYVSLEPCVGFHGKRTAACADRIAERGVRRVVVAMEDPDPRVRGQGIDQLRERGVDVEVGVLRDRAAALLAPYATHRTTGRPYVVLKLASTLDGRIAAPDGTSQWITGEAARRDVHQLRADSDAVVVGAGTVRADDPSLTVRLVDGRDPRRIVLGRAPAGAKVHPCDEVEGDLAAVLDRLGAEGVVQVLVEGGARVAGELHRRGLVDRYVLYVAPALFGGDDGPGLFAGKGAPTIGDVWRGRIVDVRQVGDDLRIDVEAA